jgi:alkylhydroperoxidase/carboxymuconolactone decarboxylase family protein YurZ
MRSAITIAFDIGRGTYDVLPEHMGIALNCGVTPDEIREIIFHSLLYCGAPSARRAWIVADEVLGDNNE